MAISLLDLCTCCDLYRTKMLVVATLERLVFQSKFPMITLIERYLSLKALQHIGKSKYYGWPNRNLFEVKVVYIDPCTENSQNCWLGDTKAVGKILLQ